MITQQMQVVVVTCGLICSVVFLFVFSATASSGPEPPHSRGFQITQNKAPQSVGLLWNSDQLVAEPFT